jgi:D-lactate dehydrogenase (cytochrome)
VEVRAIRIPRTTDPRTISRYARDESASFHGAAEAVVFPRSPDEVVEVLREASKTRTPVTVSGAGTSITGSRVPGEGIILSTERLRDWHDMERVADSPAGSGSGTGTPHNWQNQRGPDFAIGVDAGSMHALVPAGVRLSEIDHLLAPLSLFYPPDPTEQTAMLGGTIATNASGARSYRYGATREWISALLVASATGEMVWVRRGEHVARAGKLVLPEALGGSTLEIPAGFEPPPTKHAAGLLLEPDVDLVDLLIGSEGTLAVILAAVVRLAQRPEPLIQIAGFFRDPGAAFAAADSFRDDQSVLSIEYFDGRALDFTRGEYDETPRAGACLMLEIEFEPAGRHNPYPQRETIAVWEQRLREHGVADDWVATGEELAGMKAFRHALPEQVNRWAADHVGKLGTDMAVPASAFPRMHTRYEEAQAGAMRSVLFGHLGAYHLHLNFLPSDEVELAQAKTRYLELARSAVSLGGTISAEHGVGRKTLADEQGIEKPYIAFLYGDAGIRAMQDVKRAFDPDWLLNPGCMVPRP